MLGKRNTCAWLAAFQQSQARLPRKDAAAGDGAGDGFLDPRRHAEDTLSYGIITWLMSLEGQAN